MIILPAIDLRGGRCVRLRQGRFDEETVFDEDPAAVARRFQAAGAEWLHVVDLDGAREGEPKNLDHIRAICKAVDMKIEVGGGIRSTEASEEVFEAGADRIVVGTRAVREPKWLKELAEKFPGRVAWGLDTRNARVAVGGWGEVTEKTAPEIIGQAAKLRLAAIVYTDIERDGMLSGPNLTATQLVVTVSPWPVIASGGVTTVKDIQALKEVGAAGAIIGRALYEGKLTLEAALAAAAD
ncbi:MAG: 1-(5-phosphoribosyl)-5-[(5-phosphoribosylamino)methylideneamino]imidazole-4-carboxamide isomerase [Phycisphaerae bacterium]|nr:1-(5-phosphoribosyl)-5-[(5-phosphoribosylamino)methylideneamino]imidazole-4-carboxamide isomerase [Phycisphaerae bacterium]